MTWDGNVLSFSFFFFLAFCFLAIAFSVPIHLVSGTVIQLHLSLRLSTPLLLLGHNQRQGRGVGMEPGSPLTYTSAEQQ